MQGCETMNMICCVYSMYAYVLKNLYDESHVVPIRLIICDCVCRVRAQLLESFLLTSWHGRHGCLEQILMMKTMRNLRRCWSRHRAHRLGFHLIMNPHVQTFTFTLAAVPFDHHQELWQMFKA